MWTQFSSSQIWPEHSCKVNEGGGSFLPCKTVSKQLNVAVSLKINHHNIVNCVEVSDVANEILTDVNKWDMTFETTEVFPLHRCVDHRISLLNADQTYLVSKFTRFALPACWLIREPFCGEEVWLHGVCRDLEDLFSRPPPHAQR